MFVAIANHACDSDRDSAESVILIGLLLAEWQVSELQNMPRLPKIRLTSLNTPLEIESLKHSSLRIGSSTIRKDA